MFFFCEQKFTPVTPPKKKEHVTVVIFLLLENKALDCLELLFGDSPSWS
jgi:hypothetical protein